VSELGARVLVAGRELGFRGYDPVPDGIVLFRCERRS
jgi:hypothetical protein